VFLLPFAIAFISLAEVVSPPWAIIQETPELEFKKVHDDFNKAQMSFVAELRKAKSQDEAFIIKTRLAPNVNEFIPRFLALAKKAPKSKVSFDALSWIIRHSDNYAIIPEEEQAVAILMRDHLENLGLGELAFLVMSSRTEVAKSLLHQMASSALDHPNKGQACFSLASICQSWADQADHFKWMSNETRQKQSTIPDYAKWMAWTAKLNASNLRQESERYFELVVVRFSNLPRFKKQKQTLGELSRIELDNMRRLAVGKQAPETVGDDIEENPIKLSEFRGKVVVVSFWASWCGPCMRFVPDEIALVKKFQDKQFVMLGVNADETRKDAIAAIQKHAITWRSFWNEGKPDGSISKLWNVSVYPSVFVIDHNGIIRAKWRHSSPEDGTLQNVVENLIQEQSSK
jgi:thiol-disulfide isomerase/thioredoxin